MVKPLLIFDIFSLSLKTAILPTIYFIDSLKITTTVVSISGRYPVEIAKRGSKADGKTDKHNRT